MPQDPDELSEDLPAENPGQQHHAEEEYPADAFAAQGEESMYAESAQEAPAGYGEPAGGEPAEPLLQPCTNCATLLDVSDAEPFAKVHCPICGTGIRARTQLKNFTLVEVLGAGGMGAVYKALDTNLDRMVALKVVRKEYSADAEYLAKFEREARITASVNHPHVVKVYSFGSDHGLFYIAMELVDKGSLDDLMNLQGRVAEVQALGVGIQIAQGLQAAHQKGLIHRDVKPGNILFADAQTSKIVDFGLALLAEHEAEERGEVWGTPYYVAPEKLDHQPEDFRSDMYSLGGTLFHAIAGRPPFEADTASMVALKHLKSKAVSLQAFAPDVSSATAYVINRTLNKDPEQRYQSYAELIEHLEYARAQLATGGPRKPKERVVVEGAGQQKVAGIITLILLVLLAGAGAGLWAFRDRIFHHNDAVPGAVADPESAQKGLYDQFANARKQIVAGDYAAAAETLKNLEDADLAQPLQDWVTLTKGMAALLQGNAGDARDWFKVVNDRGHFSNDPSDAALVHFFSDVGSTMSKGNPVPAGQGSQWSLDNFEALAPFLFGLKDWSQGKFDDAATLLNLYLSASPHSAFGWVADYKPMARRMAEDITAYQKAAAAAAGADTPEKRADALRQVQAVREKATGEMAKQLDKIAADLKKKSADLDPVYNQQVADQKQHDTKAIAGARKQYAAFCAEFRFDEARSAVAAATVSSPDAARDRDLLLKKAEWLCRFKTQLLQDLAAYGYSGPVGTRTGARLPDGTVRSGSAGLFVQTPFGAVPVEWSTLPSSSVLAMATGIAQALAAGSPQQAAERQWLAGVFACEEGDSRDGYNLLVMASQVKNEYKDQLGLFIGTQ